MRALGAVSLGMLVLVWLALDDITTDDAVTFPLEYTILVAAGLWFAGVGVWLAIRRDAIPAAGSLAAVALGVVACWSLPHHYQPATAVNSLGWVTLLWLAGLTIWLLKGRRVARRRA